jgi:ribose-phosphate pyrophosphokinase
VIDSLHAEPSASPNDKLARMLFFIGSLRDAGAARVTAVVPYLAYARKDRRTWRNDPVTTRYMGSLFEAVGCDALMTLDVHNVAAFQNAFRTRACNLEAAPVLARRLAELVGAEGVAVVSPDPGGIKRAERLRRRLGEALGREVGFAFAEKHRGGGELRGGAFAGDVRGRTAILVDDLIATGSTLALAANACMQRGATRVLAAASHGLFCGDCVAAIGEAPIERVLVSDSVGFLPDRAAPLAARIERVTVAPMFARAIADALAGADPEGLP